MSDNTVFILYVCNSGTNIKTVCCMLTCKYIFKKKVDSLINTHGANSIECSCCLLCLCYVHVHVLPLLLSNITATDQTE